MYNEINLEVLLKLNGIIKLNFISGEHEYFCGLSSLEILSFEAYALHVAFT